MGNEQRIDAFSAFRPFIRLLNIFDSANYQNSDQRLVIRNVCHASVFAILIFSLALTLVSDAWFCIGVKFDLSVSVLQLGLLINASQFAVTYISIRWRVQLINETIRNLNRMTNKRGCFSNLTCSDIMRCWLRVNVTKLILARALAKRNHASIEQKLRFPRRDFSKMCALLSTGSKISESLFTSYEQLEERFFAWTKTTIKFSSCMITFVFVIPAMVPVAYVMFGTPPPHQWTTVYGFRLVLTLTRPQCYGMSCLLFSKIGQFCRCLALPSEMNVFFSYYMDWLNGLVSTVMYYIMLTTAALFFIGMCFYISEMARDLQASMAGYNEATPRQRMIDDIVFHQEILKWESFD